MTLADERYMEQIADAAERAVSYVEGVAFETFSADRLTRAAVEREIEIAGRAAALLTDRARAERSDLPLDALARLAEECFFHYDGIEIADIWRAAAIVLPEVLGRLRPDGAEDDDD